MKNNRNTTQTRETAAVLMFVVVFISLLRPISPFIADGLGHTFWNDQHHTSLHQNGINHIDKQIQKLNEKSDEQSREASASTFNIETSLIYFEALHKINFYISSTTIEFSEPLFLNSQQNVTPEIQPPDISRNVLPIHA